MLYVSRTDFSSYLYGLGKSLMQAAEYARDNDYREDGVSFAQSIKEGNLEFFRLILEGREATLKRESKNKAE